MSAPAIGTAGLDIYRSLEPLAFDDPAQNYALLTLAAAHGAMLQPVDDLVSDTDDGPGWSSILDIDRCPTAALPWLAQFVGVQLTQGDDDATQRQMIRDQPNAARGTPGAIAAAAQSLLTGDRNVFMIERASSAYTLTVITYASETPDPDAVEALLLSPLVKPAGVKLTYQCVDGQTWAQLIVNYPTWADVISAYGTWQDVINDTP